MYHQTLSYEDQVRDSEYVGTTKKAAQQQRHALGTRTAATTTSRRETKAAC